MSKVDIFLKRAFDILVAFVCLCLFLPIILICWVIAALDTGSNGFFIQKRVGRYGQLIHVFKIKTMYPGDDKRSPIASRNIVAISCSGRVLRKYKLDELPQLFNVLAGSMSLVGPRPDVPGYADRLQGEDRIILSLRPGITGPASIKYKDEESILAAVDDPESYNDRIIWPDKVKINREYCSNYSFLRDLRYIFQTIFG